MQSMTAGKTQTTGGKATFRDKRYVVPLLLVDLLSSVSETRLWSASQLILRDFVGDVAQNEDFTGSFTFDDDKTTLGLFQARAVKRDPARGLVGAEFRWLSERARALIADKLARRNPDAPDQGPVMKVSVALPTANWSLSGMLLERYHGNLAAGEAFGGMIRLEKTQEPGPFNAVVIRVNAEQHTLALKFSDLSSSTFALLEAAIKKSNAS
jgi:hypothetical protein